MIDAMKRIFRRVGTLVGEPVTSREYPSSRVLEEGRALGKMLAENVAQE